MRFRGMSHHDKKLGIHLEDRYDLLGTRDIFLYAIISIRLYWQVKLNRMSY